MARKTIRRKTVQKQQSKRRLAIMYMVKQAETGTAERGGIPMSRH
ncbi:hypothetical protein [Paracoccus binzhouensis]|nr:hypothetical protein [Paracoccus binzhouensis]